MERKLSLLLVDPSKQVRELVKAQFLLDENIEIVEAENGEIAWELFQLIFPVVVISETILPAAKMNAFEFSRAIHSALVLDAFKDTHVSPLVIAFSAFDDEFTRYWAVQQGFDDLIAKSFPQGYEALGTIVKAYLKTLYPKQLGR